MNLQWTFNQNNPFSLGFDYKSNKKDLTLQLNESHDQLVRIYQNQKQEILEADISEPIQKNNLILNQETINVIGENAKNRFNEFKTYPIGWYGGKGKKISKGSFFTFTQFIKSLPEIRRVRPSLFMTLEGNLSLGWEDKNSKIVEVEFYSDKIEYYIQSLDKESEIRLFDIVELTEELRKLLN